MTRIKSFFLDQHGCAKNQVDAEIIISRLVDLGFQEVFDAENADLIIINSCGFIESAKKESLESLYNAKKNYPNAKILLTGCLAERYAEIFKNDLPEADGIFGNGDLSKIEEIVVDLQNEKRSVKKYAQNGVCCYERKKLLGFAGSAYVKITEGCSNFCSFCAIPVIRGKLRSRPIAEIIEEIKNLVKNKVVEINLIGQDLAAFGTGEQDEKFDDGKSGLYHLLEEISKIQGDFWVRLLYIHPDHFPRDIFDIMRRDLRFLRYFDIPFQSGDDKIIFAMNRKGTAKIYTELIGDIRKNLSGAVIRTTFLTGFPGETEQSFENTKKFLQEIQTMWSGAFDYSREEDTAAYNFKNRVSKKIAIQRKNELCKIQAEITERQLKSFVGKKLDILIEEIIEGDEGIAIGRAYFNAPEVDGNVVVCYEKNDKKQSALVKCGNFVKVKVISSSEVDLNAVLEIQYV